MDKTIQIDTFTRLTQVSRETITSLKKYEDVLINANKTLNLVGNSTINATCSICPTREEKRAVENVAGDERKI